MMLITGMSISGKMSVAMLRSTNGVASTISIAITMNVYGRRSASSTIDMGGARRGDGRRRGETAMIFRVVQTPSAMSYRRPPACPTYRTPTVQ